MRKRESVCEYMCGVCVRERERKWERERESGRDRDIVCGCLNVGIQICGQESEGVTLHNVFFPPLQFFPLTYPLHFLLNYFSSPYPSLSPLSSYLPPLSLSLSYFSCIFLPLLSLSVQQGCIFTVFTKYIRSRILLLCCNILNSPPHINPLNKSKSKEI